MKLRRIDPKKIRIPETRVTAQMDEETTRQFEASVQSTGIDEPIKCYQVGEELWLSDGLHRLQMALRSKQPTVEAYVRDGTIVDVLCNNLMSGHLRGKHPLSGMVKVIESLFKEHQVGIEDIQKRTGLTRDHIESVILISELTPMVRAAVDEGNLNFSQALALTRIKDPQRQEVVFGQWQLARWSAKELNEFVTTVLAIQAAPAAAQVPSEPVEPAVIRCFYCQQPGLPGQLTNPNTCTSCAGILLGSFAQARADAKAEKGDKTE